MREPRESAEGLRVLVTDGSSLSARQVVTALGRSGAHVELVDSSSLPLAGFSRYVSHVHTVPAFARDPWGWFEATLNVLAKGQLDLLLAVHEQTAVVAHSPTRVRELGVAVAVPPFGSLRLVQDKLEACAALDAAGLACPPTRVVRSPEELRQPSDAFPFYLKERIGTASTAVFPVTDGETLEAAASKLSRRRAFRDGVLVQEAVDGPVLMIQAVFDRGELVAHHVNTRVRAGASGASSHKRSVRDARVEHDLVDLGRFLEWHGALSLDAVDGGTRLWYIDVNPRLVEPGNAERAGVDLVATLVDVALGRGPAAVPPGRPGLGTHQLMLALLGAAERDGGRRAIASELVSAILGSGDYAGSREELTPVMDDRASAVPLVAMAASLLARPESHQKFTGGAIANYALTAPAWRQICEREPERAATVDAVV
jgi:predicted ATP-grasp superfamily ATP-dependent carboligase